MGKSSRERELQGHMGDDGNAGSISSRNSGLRVITTGRLWFSAWWTLWLEGKEWNEEKFFSPR